jgi:hypothetical protein
MGVTDEQIQRIYDRLDGIERSLEKRLRALEIWQAYQTGRLTALALFFSALGAVVMGALGFCVRHLKLMTVAVAALTLVLLSGCASAPRTSAGFSTAETASHVASATQYVEQAEVSAGAARRGLEKIKAACAAVPAPKKAAVKAAFERIDEGRIEAEAQLEQVTLKLAAARDEQQRTGVALEETQSKISSLEAYNVCLTKDRDSAVQRADAVQKTNVRLSHRLVLLALAVAGCAALVAWIVLRAVGLKALPSPYCYAWPGLAAAGAGAAVFTYLRYYL